MTLSEKAVTISPNRLTFMSLRFCTSFAAIVGTSLLPLSGMAQSAPVQSLADRQIQNLESLKSYAEQAIDKGQEALDQNDYESAFAYYKSAVDVLPSSGAATAETREVAVTGFSKAAVLLAQQRISEGRLQDAKTTVAVVLEERYNPNYKPALDLEAKLNQSGRFNPALTPSFIANVEEVKQLLNEAQGFYASGRYDLAFKRYEQVLNIDRHNIAARRGMEEVNRARSQYASVAYSEARGEMLTQVDKGWELPVRRFDMGPSTIIDQPQIDTRGTTAINRKLDEIIVPRIEFRDATIREAMDFLRQRAGALDTSETDPTRKGVNIVLKLAPGSPEESVGINLSLTDVPLRAAIEYVAKAASLKPKIEPYAVLIVPENEPTDVLITKEYKVPPSFISNLPSVDAGGGGSVAGGGGVNSVAPGSESAIAARSGAREFLEGQGVSFPPGASAVFLASTSKLIVKNTQGNLDIIDALVETEFTTPPSQVEIESKFLEVTQNNLQELGFDWLIGQFGLPFGSGVYGGGGTQGFSQNINANAYPFLNPSPNSSIPIGATSTTSGPLTAGNRSGTTAISVNAVDALLFATPAGPAPAVMALAGVFTNPQFQVVIRALNQQKGVDLVSAPKVTTKSGQRATIDIVREFRYPAEYDLPQVSATVGSQFTPVVPTTPTSFETKNVGITLEVEPTVGPDGNTIDLILAPRVVEFEGFINYGSPINASVQAVGDGIITPPTGSTTIEATPNVINRPVFSTREVTTEVTVYDGQTVVLGGLMREDIQKVQDKVPILGDIPIAGRLFRSVADQHIKRNLIMFVTANLLDPAGQPLIQVDEEHHMEDVPNVPAIADESIPGDASTIPLPQ